MTTLRLLENWVSPALVRALGYALLHSLWQGAVLAGLLAAALPLLRRHRPEVRYAASAAALAGLLLVVAGTFGYYHGQEAAAPLRLASQLPVVVVPVLPAAAPAPRPLGLLLAQQAEPYLPLLVAAWLLGLLLMGARLAGGLVVASRLRRVGTQALGGEWQRRLAALAARAGLRRPVALLESGRVRGPLVLGYLRPAILLPLGAVAGLPPALLEALLAHELAHVLRRDYLLNLLLAAVEVLFFYHPAVWFMAACLRAERENCCDDHAATLCGGDRLRVARALAALAELEATLPAPRLALAAAGVGGRGSLLARVRRLALGRPQAPGRGEALLVLLLSLLGVVGLGTGLALAAPAAKPTLVPPPQTPAASAADTSRRAGKVAPVPAAAAATLPAGSTAAEAASDLVAPAEAAAPAAASAPAAGAAGPFPPRRAGSTIVLEKDKKGRLQHLLVDGQPVLTEEPDKKAKRGKRAGTLEIVTAPAAPQLADGWRNLDKPFSDHWQQSNAVDNARRSLAQSLQAPGLTDEQRQSIEQTLENLSETEAPLGELPARPPFQLLETPRRQQYKLVVPKRSYRLSPSKGWSGSLAPAEQLPGPLGPGPLSQADLAKLQREMQQQQRQLQRESQQFQREMQQQQRALQQHQREMQQQLRATSPLGADEDLPAPPDARTEARRAQLEARIAAAEAELSALDAPPAATRGSSAATDRGARLRRLPQPPRPPRAPRALPVPPAPAAPAAPASPFQTTPPPPPPPPPPGPEVVRDELRRDGLIGKTDKNFSLQLSDQRVRVNGRALTPEQARKYRSLLGHENTKDHTELRMEMKEN